MAYWLIKTEPSDYSFDDLLREGRTVWSGVKNPLAKKHLHAMKKGDELLLYHTGNEKAVVGTASVVKAAASDQTEPLVEIGSGTKLRRPVTLAEIKADKRFKEWGLVRIGRLSVVPTTKEQFEGVMALSGNHGK
jgi:predicted RNA-binding protein with PUA-like domain